MPESLAIIILTHNEADNLPRCLRAIDGFGEVIVVGLVEAVARLLATAR